MPVLETLRSKGKTVLSTLTAPVVSGLVRLGVTPIQVSTAGIVFAVAAAIAIAFGAYPVAGVFYLLAGIIDTLDGAMARKMGAVSAVGAFLDSTLDRIVEGIVLAGLAYRFADLGRPLDTALVVLLLTASVLISYTRARAESLGADCSVGIVARAERIAILVAGLLLSAPRITLYVLLVLCTISAGQRIAYGARRLSETEPPDSDVS